MSLLYSSGMRLGEELPRVEMLEQELCKAFGRKQRKKMLDLFVD